MNGMGRMRALRCLKMEREPLFFYAQNLSKARFHLLSVRGKAGFVRDNQHDKLFIYNSNVIFLLILPKLHAYRPDTPRRCPGKSVDIGQPRWQHRNQ